MDLPLDLKLLMNNTTAATATTNTITKIYKCDQCSTTYADKAYYDLHRQSHKQQQQQQQQHQHQPAEIQTLQIVMSPQQVLPQPAPAHQQQQQQQQVAAPQFIRAYIDEATNQVYTLTPVSQYHPGLSTSPRSIMNVTSALNIPSLTAPTYVMAATAEQLQQIQPQQQEQEQEQEQQQHQHQHHHLQQQQQQQHQQQEEEQIQQEQQQEQIQKELQNQSILQKNGTQRMMFDSKERPYKCDKCTASFIDSIEFEDHRKKHSGDGPFTCDDCHFTFMYKNHFRSHKTRCQKKKSMNPVNFNKTIVPNMAIKRQFPTNLSPPPVVHTINQQPHHNIQHQMTPQQSQSSPITTTSHRQIVKPNQNQIKLQVQTLFNPSNPTFKRIKKESRQDRPFECSECDASFQSMADLTTHKTKHTGEGPFKCDECQFVFLYRKLHEAHRRRCEKKRKTDQDTSTSSPIPDSNTVSSSITTSSIPLTSGIQHIQIPQIQIQQTPQLQIPTRSLTTTSGALPTVNLSAPLQVHTVQGQGQPTVIDMRSATSQQIPLQHIQVGQHQGGILEQVLQVAPGVAGRSDIKYEMMPSTVSLELDNFKNRIFNLMKVQDSPQ